jgi:Kef-type K+ transport system membrane component KefB
MVLAWLVLPEMKHHHALVLLIVVAFSISVIPEAVKVFSDLGLFRSGLGETVVSVSIMDDVLGLFLLAVLTALAEAGHVPGPASLGFLLLKIAIFFAVTGLLGVHVYPRVSKRIRGLQVAALAYGLLAEILSMHWILGAFMAGLFWAGTNGDPILTHLFSALALMAVVTPLLLRALLPTRRDTERD